MGDLPSQQSAGLGLSHSKRLLFALSSPPPCVPLVPTVCLPASLSPVVYLGWG